MNILPSGSKFSYKLFNVNPLSNSVLVKKTINSVEKILKDSNIKNTGGMIVKQI